MPRRGRTRFYDSYGVVRDVLQNHLTEVLALVAMETGVPGDNNANTERLVKAKLAVLCALRPAEPQRTLFAQYAAYRDHVRADHNGMRIVRADCQE